LILRWVGGVVGINFLDNFFPVIDFFGEAFFVAFFLGEILEAELGGVTFLRATL
jgi:hypothetical protein